MDTTAATTAPAAPAASPRRVAIPGGSALVVDEIRVPARGRDDESLIAQALAGPDGPLVRVGYGRSGRVVRGPVTVAPGELADLVGAIRAHPAFAGALAAVVGG